MQIKKLMAIVLAIVTVLSFAACTHGTADDASTQTERTTEAVETTEGSGKTPMSIAALKGPTGMGMAKLIAEVDAGLDKANDYSFELMASPDEIVSAVSSGACDIAACPLNLAAVLYKKTSGSVQMLAVNTLGVLYVVENGNTIKSIADLKGKTIYSTGQGSSPEYVLNYILNANGLTVGKDVKVEYLAQHSELTTKAAAGKATICVLPEPNVTTALSKNTKLRVALDLTKEWEKACKLNKTESQLAQGCLIVNKKYAKENSAAVDAFLTEYKASVDYVNMNATDSANVIAALEIVSSAAIAEKALPNCNIVCITGEKMKTIATQNLEVLFKANPQSVGGAMPGEDFWYAG